MAALPEVSIQLRCLQNHNAEWSLRKHEALKGSELVNISVHESTKYSLVFQWQDTAAATP